MTVSVLQKPTIIAGMLQKVNPFKSSQPKAADAQSGHSDSSTTGSMADGNKQVESVRWSHTNAPQPLILFR